VNDLKFLGLNINNTLTWKPHIETILPKLSSACFAMRSIKLLVSQHMLKTIYYSHFHTIISYGLMFWGNSAHNARVFRKQKKIIRIMAGSRSRDSCRKLFNDSVFFYFHLYISLPSFGSSWKIGSFLPQIMRYMNMIHDRVTTFISLWQI
jgi:hypothetical protein